MCFNCTVCKAADWSAFHLLGYTLSSFLPYMVGYFITNQLDNCSPWQANQIERTRVIKTPFFRSVFSMASFSLKKCSLLVYMENMLRFPLTHTKQLTFFTFYNTIRKTCKWNLGFGFNENKSFVWLMRGLCSFILNSTNLCQAYDDFSHSIGWHPRGAAYGHKVATQQWSKTLKEKPRNVSSKWEFRTMCSGCMVGSTA